MISGNAAFVTRKIQKKSAKYPKVLKIKKPFKISVLSLREYEKKLFLLLENGTSPNLGLGQGQ